jgi:hypothetical protein
VSNTLLHRVQRERKPEVLIDRIDERERFALCEGTQDHLVVAADSLEAPADPERNTISRGLASTLSTVSGGR